MKTNELPILQESFYKPIKEKFIKLLDEKSFMKEIGFAIQIISASDVLQKCSQQSILEAVYNISQTSLTLNPVLKYAYLIPRKGKCLLEPGYQGLIKLATDTDNIISINVQLVYEGDECEVDLASERIIEKHIPYQVLGNEKGGIKFGYSIATLQDGSKHCEIMSYRDIMDVREYSESYKYYKKEKDNKSWVSCVWITDEPEMCRKTIVKRHFKYLPKSDNKHLEKAIELDNQDYDFAATYEQGNYIESLLMSAAIPEKQEREIYNTLHNNDFTSKRAAKCIEYLLEHQQDPIDAGKTYQQRDITKKLNELKDA